MKSSKFTFKRYILCLVLFCCINISSVYANEQSVDILLKKDQIEQLIDPVNSSQEKDKQIEHLIAKQQAFETRYYTLAGITLLLIVLFGFLCFRKKNGEKHLEKIIDLLEKKATQKSNSGKKSDSQIDIDEMVVVSILENLQAFEKEKGFLISKITLTEFAKQLQTNTKYLSKVINTHKLKSFRSYINDLRIQYSIQELKQNVNYRKYTVKAMAKEAGFTTAESFSKAFQKRTGETVSGFLRQF